MNEPAAQLTDRIKALAGSWPAYATVGGALLYLLGYLSLRFHLTALGTGLDTTVVDERYLFTGARFLVYLVVAVQGVVVVALLLIVPCWIVTRLVPHRARRAVGSRMRRPIDWATEPSRLALLGILLSVYLIQAWMRDCFELDDLLLRSRLPEHNRLADWLATGASGSIELFFLGLVAGCMVCSAVLLAAWTRPAQAGGGAVLRPLLAFLVAVQCLLLPVNYGYLIVDKKLPRVASLDGTTPLPEGSRAWLVWDGKDGITFLRRGGDGARSLVFLKRDEVKRIEIVGNDPIVRELHLQRRGE